MFQRALATILRGLESAGSALIGYEDVYAWPPGLLATLVSKGWLQEGDCARGVVCEGCEQACLAQVVYIADEEGRSARAYAACEERDDMGRVSVPLHQLEQWRVDANGVAGWIADQLRIGEALEVAVEGLLWQLGEARIGNRSLHCFLATGDWHSAARIEQVRSSIGEADPAVLLVPVHPDTETRLEHAAKIVPLARILKLTAEGPLLDRRALERVVGKGRTTRRQPTVPFDTPLGATWENLSIEFLNAEHVKITVQGKTDHRDFASMGFADRRKPDDTPVGLWAFLHLLAVGEGQIAWGDGTPIPEENRYKVKKRISELRVRLRDCFPRLAGDPIAPYSKRCGYRTRFVLLCSEAHLRSLGDNSP